MDQQKCDLSLHLGDSDTCPWLPCPANVKKPEPKTQYGLLWRQDGEDEVMYREGEQEVVLQAQIGA